VPFLRFSEAEFFKTRFHAAQKELRIQFKKTGHEQAEGQRQKPHSRLGRECGTRNFKIQAKANQPEDELPEWYDSHEPRSIVGNTNAKGWATRPFLKCLRWQGFEDGY